MFSSFWGSNAIPSQGAAGGLFIAWKNDIFDQLALEHGTQSLSVKLKDKQEGSLWRITIIYGPSSISCKTESGRNWMTLTIL